MLNLLFFHKSGNCFRKVYMLVFCAIVVTGIGGCSYGGQNVSSVQEQSDGVSNKITKNKSKKIKPVNCWTVENAQDEFGDDVEGKYIIAGSFETDGYQDIYIGVGDNELMGPYISFYQPYSVFYGNLSLKVRQNGKDSEYILISDDNNILYLFDYYTYYSDYMDGLVNSISGTDGAYSSIMESPLVSDYSSNEKKLYNVKKLIKKLYKSKEEIKFVILGTNGNKVRFTIPYGNFKSSFDSVWNYKKFMKK